MSKRKLVLLGIAGALLATIWIVSAYAGGDPSPPHVNGLISPLF